MPTNVSPYAASAADKTDSSLRSYEEFAKAKPPENNMDKNAFLKLLVAQMQYQNPMEPMDNSQFITQMAQFTSLEQMQAMNSTMNASYNYSLAGKYVYAYADGIEIFGQVDRVINENDEMLLQVGEYVFKSKFVREVYDSSLFEGSSNNSLLDNSSLIGRKIVAETMDEEGAVVRTEGVVTRVRVENGTVYAYVDDKKVAINTIVDISQA